MKGTLAVSVLLAFSGTAIAEETSMDLDPNPLETPWSQPLRIKKWVDQPHINQVEARIAGGFSNIIYLNNCKPNGCVLTPGNDATQNKSSIIGGTVNVQPYAFSDANWQQVVDCVKQTYAPFGVQIVTARPPSGNYHMAVVAGYPQNIGEPQGVGGVSPFACGYLPNAVSYSFANIYGGDVDEICHVVAQETAHSWGLDHKFDNRDPMTYLSSGPSRKNFVNESGPCGEFSARSCDCGGNSMNSYAEIFDTFGGKDPTPPTIEITVPMANQTGLPPGFPVQAEVDDDVGVAKVELRIDNMLIATKEKAPWSFAAPANTSDGTHQIELTAYDYSGTTAKKMIMATVGSSCATADQCPANNVCLQGRCVLGGGAAGGLGTTCTTNTDCSSGQCAGDGAGNQYCVEACDPDGAACPSGFDCLGAPGSAVCWPGAEEGVCNVGANGHGKAAPAFLLIGLAAIFVLRRRRR